MKHFKRILTLFLGCVSIVKWVTRLQTYFVVIQSLQCLDYYAPNGLGCKQLEEGANCVLDLVVMSCDVAIFRCADYARYVLLQLKLLCYKQHQILGREVIHILEFLDLSQLFQSSHYPRKISCWRCRTGINRNQTADFNGYHQVLVPFIVAYWYLFTGVVPGFAWQGVQAPQGRAATRSLDKSAERMFEATSWHAKCTESFWLLVKNIWEKLSFNHGNLKKIGF